MLAPAQLVVEQHARARAALAVHVAQARRARSSMPRDPERVARGDDQPLLAVHEPDDRDVARRRARGRRRAACTRRSPGSSRCEPAMWQSPSRSATSPPSEPTFEEASVTPGIGGAQRGRREVEHEVVGADRDDRAVDLAHAAQERDVDLLAGVVALEPGGHDEQAVGAHERGEHAGAARQRRGHELAADPPESHAHPVVHAHRRGELARQPRAGARALAPAPRPRGRPAAARRRSRRSARRRPGSRARRAPASPSTAPSTTGWPGRTATPWTASVPSRSTTAAV